MRGLKYDDKFLLLFWDKMVYFKAHYIYPSQETLLTWLRNQGGLDVSRRTLNRYLRHLQKRQLIGRIRRLKKSRRGGLQYNTTLYSIGLLGLLKLRSMGVIAFNEFKAFINNSAPFRSRQPKKLKPGLTPADPGFYTNFKTIGELVHKLI